MRRALLAVTLAACATAPQQVRQACDLGEPACSHVHDTFDACSAKVQRTPDGAPSHFSVVVSSDASGHVTAQRLASSDAPAPDAAFQCITEKLQAFTVGPSLVDATFDVSLSNASTGITQGEFLETMKGGVPAITKCVEEQRKRDASVHGKLLLRWSISTDGTVHDLSTQTPEFQGTPIAACISAVISALQFPVHPEEAEPILFPFKF